MLSVRPISELGCIRQSTLAQGVQMEVSSIRRGALGIPMMSFPTMRRGRVVLLAASTMMFLGGPAAAQNSGPFHVPAQHRHEDARPLIGPNGATAGAGRTGQANRAENAGGVTPANGNPNQYGPNTSSGGYGLWGLLGLIGLFGLFRGPSRPLGPDDYTGRP